jgi:TonB-dependent SusC/RagA subfamily outer membrane receptor
METLFTYIIHVTCLLALIWLFLVIALRQHTFYTSNRWYFFGGITLAFLLPCVSLPESAAIHPVVQQTVIFFDHFSPIEPQIAKKVVLATDLITWSIGGGMVLFACLFCIRLVSFFRLRRRAQKETIEGTTVFLLQEDIKPFSFWGDIFLNPSIHSRAEIGKIIAHEIFHIKQKHTIDLMLTEVLAVICWFNPFVWLLRKAMRQNLEYLADRHVLNSGFDTMQYQYMLVRTSVAGIPGLSIAHNFTFSNLKKRIIMMNKQPSSRIALCKYLLLIPFFAFAWMGMNAGEIIQNQERKTISQEKVENIDPETIKSITVLKGKSATDLYGEEAADGVIEITLKTGEVKVIKPSESNSGTLRVLERSSNQKILQVDTVYSIPKSETTLRLNNSVNKDVLFIVDGNEVDSFTVNNLSADNIESISVLKDQAAIKEYGEKGKNGVVIVTTKKK